MIARGTASRLNRRNPPNAVTSSGQTQPQIPSCGIGAASRDRSTVSLPVSSAPTRHTVREGDKGMLRIGLKGPGDRGQHPGPVPAVRVDDIEMTGTGQLDEPADAGRPAHPDRNPVIG